MRGVSQDAGGFVAECFWPGAAQSDVVAAAERVRRSAAEEASEVNRVELVDTIYMPDDEVVLFVFEAPSADAVREVAERAQIGHERVVRASRRPASA